MRGQRIDDAEDARIETIARGALCGCGRVVVMAYGIGPHPNAGLLSTRGMTVRVPCRLNVAGRRLWMTVQETAVKCSSEGGDSRHNHDQASTDERHQHS
jgi:hypothetical protein